MDLAPRVKDTDRSIINIRRARPKIRAWRGTDAANLIHFRRGMRFNLPTRYCGIYRPQGRVFETVCKGIFRELAQ